MTANANIAQDKLREKTLEGAREEPKVNEAHFSEGENPLKIPSYESVNILRLARNNQQSSASWL